MDGGLRGMSYYDKIKNAWSAAALRQQRQSVWQRQMAEGSVRLNHYKSYLIETYHHAGINPQIQAYTTMFFRDNPREVVKKFYQHAISEIAHDLLALADLKALGADTEKIKASRPLPSTMALNAFPLYYVQFKNPIGYLGYLFHLEFMPTTSGEGYMSSLSKLGVSREAMSFIEEHAKVDLHHNKLMEFYIDKLVTSQADCDEVIFTAESACHLHNRMIEDAFARADDPAFAP
jgi:pyrroloquinoline quinone (PQQ) biosynthesis protein C